jgi:acyl-CoA synthetase (NDP forming)
MKADHARLDRAFRPRCVAVVGDSRRTNFEWLRGQLEFRGKLYSVQVNPETIRDIEAMGVENRRSLQEIPEPVDLAIVAVNRTIAPRVLDDCIKKDVAAAHFFTAGFSETGTEEGRRLEQTLRDRAEATGFHLIGPNCMGIFNPGLGLRQGSEQYVGSSGPVGFISQSGSVALAFSLKAHLEGLDIARSVSCGNGIVLDVSDFLEYLGTDDEVKAIGMYIEGVRDGRRFRRVLEHVAARKPVVIWKGGQSSDGGRAIASHTGALAVPSSVWDSIVKQCRAVGIASTDEMIDTLKALIFLPPLRGGRMAVVGGSGGQSVAITDAFGGAGLSVPPLTRQSYEELETFFEVVGGSYRNPVDTAGPVRRDMRRITGILARDANIDNLALVVGTKPGNRMRPEQLQVNLELARETKEATEKPVAAFVFLYTPDAERETRDIMVRYQQIGIPAFPSIERGVRAIRNALEHHSR